MVTDTELLISDQIQELHENIGEISVTTFANIVLDILYQLAQQVEKQQIDVEDVEYMIDCHEAEITELSSKVDKL